MPCAFFILCQEQVATITFQDGGLNEFAWSFPVHIPPQAARGGSSLALVPTRRLKPCCLLCTCIFYFLTLLLLCSWEEGGVWDLSLTSRPLSCFHPPHSSRPSCMVFYKHLNKMLVISCWGLCVLPQLSELLGWKEAGHCCHTPGEAALCRRNLFSPTMVLPTLSILLPALII